MDVPDLYWARRISADTLDAIGFDLDFTLAPYDVGALTDVVVDEAEVRLDLPMTERLDVVRLRRGDTIDTVAARIIRTDPFGVALDAWDLDGHVPAAAIAEEYGRLGPLTPPRGRFQPVDSFYAFADAVIFLHLARCADPGADLVARWTTARAVSDAVHAEGLVYDAIGADPGRFLPDGWDIGPVIEGIRASGRKAFLVTNSPIGRANDVLAAIGATERMFDWAVFEAGKPAFFRDDDALTVADPAASPYAEHCYLGGSLRAMEEAHALRGVEILYVGDHIYGDVIRASRLRGWRTLLVVPEMDDTSQDPFRTAEGALTYFGWQAVRFAWGYSASILGLGDLRGLERPPGFVIRMPHEEGLPLPQG